MMQQFFLGVILNMLCDLILTWKLIILSILSKFNLSINEFSSLTYPEYIKINESWNKISNNLVCATSKGSDQPSQTDQSLC